MAMDGPLDKSNTSSEQARRGLDGAPGRCMGVGSGGGEGGGDGVCEPLGGPARGLACRGQGAEVGKKKPASSGL